MNRRDALAILAAPLVLGAAAAPLPAVTTILEPDAELLALCGTYHRQDEMSRDDGNLDWEAAADARHVAFMQIMDDNRCDGEWMGDSETLFALNVLKGWLRVA